MLEPTITSLRISGPSRAFRPAKNVDCSFEISFGSTLFNLFASSLDIILLMHPIRLIGRKSDNTEGCGVFGIRAINDDMHPRVMNPED
jgi:hypothetical protein